MKAHLCEIKRIIRKTERPFMVGGVHSGRASCWVELDVMGETMRVHIKVPFYNKLKAAGIPAVEFDDTKTRKQTP